MYLLNSAWAIAGSTMIPARSERRRQLRIFFIAAECSLSTQPWHFSSPLPPHSRVQARMLKTFTFNSLFLFPPKTLVKRMYLLKDDKCVLWEEWRHECNRFDANFKFNCCDSFSLIFLIYIFYFEEYIGKIAC